MLKQLDKGRILNKLIIYEDFDFKNNMHVVNWLSKASRSKEEKIWFYRFLDRVLLYAEKPEIDEVFFNIQKQKIPSIGACLAIINNHQGVINARTDDFFAQKTSNALHCWVDDNCDIQEDLVEVKHFFCESQISDLSSLDKNDKKNNISSGQDLWEQWEVLFPNLIKCGDVKENLYSHSNKYHIDLVVERLNVLQNYFAEKRKPYFYKDLIDLGLNVSDETPKTKDSSICEEDHTFILPNGEKEVFWLHIKFNTDVLVRLHFKPKDMNHCYIAHIGRHLKTSSNI